jgi:hypothetical protein
MIDAEFRPMLSARDQELVVAASEAIKRRYRND